MFLFDFPKWCVLSVTLFSCLFFLFIYPLTAGSSWSKTSARKSSTMGYSNRRWWGPGRQWRLWRQFWGGRRRGGRWWLNNTIDWLQYLHTLQTLGLTVELYNNKETQYRSFEKAEFNFSLPIKSAYVTSQWRWNKSVAIDTPWNMLMAHYSLQVQDGAFVSTENKSFFIINVRKCGLMYCLISLGSNLSKRYY